PHTDLHSFPTRRSSDLDTTLADAISELDDEELAALAPTLTRGVFTGSPVFDGSKESEIKALLRSSGLPESGKTYLYDGMTGEKLDRKSTRLNSSHVSIS